MKNVIAIVSTSEPAEILAIIEKSKCLSIDETKALWAKSEGLNMFPRNCKAVTLEVTSFDELWEKTLAFSDRSKIREECNKFLEPR